MSIKTTYTCDICKTIVAKGLCHDIFWRLSDTIVEDHLSFQMCSKCFKTTKSIIESGNAGEITYKIYWKEEEKND